MRPHLACCVCLALMASGGERVAHALDKQGSAHGGEVSNDSSGFGVSGSLTLGSAIVNPTYAARPDNTGLALLRYAGHADVDLIGSRLSIPIDVNMFTDRTRGGAKVLLPTELDLIVGLTTTHAAGPGAIELGARVEHDRPVDQVGATQTYVDARARYLFSTAKVIPSVGRDLKGGDLTGQVTLGWFAYNPSYYARPDNTGRALFRYALHTELSVVDDAVAIGVDMTFFSDGQASNVLRPSELDFTYDFIVRASRFECHLAYERDMPVDRGGLVQSFVYALFVYPFDLRPRAAGSATTARAGRPIAF